MIGFVKLTAVEVQVLAGIRKRGAMWRPKDPEDKRIPTSWSATLIEYAGGLEALAREWEPEE